MNIKKTLKQKIGFYEKQPYSSFFFKMLSDVANNKFDEEKKLFNVRTHHSANQLWIKVSYCIDEFDEEYGIPKLVYLYLLKKAKEIYLRIEKFCNKEKYNVKDIIKIYIDCSNKLLLAYRWDNKANVDEILMGKRTSTKVMPAVSLNTKRRNGFGQLATERKENEQEEEDEEQKKRKAMKKFTNIFIGDVDLTTTSKKNQQIKIFEGQYCKTFILVDEDKSGPKKMEVKNFSPSKLNSKFRKNINLKSADLNTLTVASSKKYVSARLSPDRVPTLQPKSTDFDNKMETLRLPMRKKNTFFKTVSIIKSTQSVTKSGENSESNLNVYNFNSFLDFENKYGLKFKNMNSKKI